MHVGNQMAGGKITVNGDADDWAGAMLKGGELEITGNAGHYVGAAYRGFWKGMMNGIIKVKGKVGNEALSWVSGSKPAKRFPTLICGSASSFLGIHSHGGTVQVSGKASFRVSGEIESGIHRSTLLQATHIYARLP